MYMIIAKRGLEMSEPEKNRIRERINKRIADFAAQHNVPPEIAEHAVEQAAAAMKARVYNYMDWAAGQVISGKSFDDLRKMSPPD